MTSNINIISADITIFDELTIFVMSFYKKRGYITTLMRLSGLAVNILVMLWT